MKKGWVLLILKIVIFLGVLFALYYFLFLRPRTILVRNLVKLQSELSKNRGGLAENRIFIVEFARLDPKDPNFLFKKEQALGIIQRTNKEGLERVKEAKTGDLLIRGESGNTSKIPTFPPRGRASVGMADSLDVVSQKEELIARSEAAIKGLSRISAGLKEQTGDLSTDSVQNEIDKTVESLSVFINLLKNGDYQGAKDERSEISNQFQRLKEEAFELELSVIKSDGTVKLLTDETNLILEYDFYLEKIDSVINTRI